MKRKQWPNDWVKKNMDMDMHSKPAAQERAIPENDKHENENLEMRENMAKRAKILTNIEIQTCSICSETVVDLARHIMDMHSKPAAAPEKMILYRNGLKRPMDMHSKPATPENTMPTNNLYERECLFVAFDLESTGETQSFFFCGNCTSMEECLDSFTHPRYECQNNSLTENLMRKI